MLTTNSVIKRYTPPTCTLQILSKNFSFPKWLRKNSHQDLSFELSVDDPRLPETKQINIKGNYQQLKLLSEIVLEYIHNWLPEENYEDNHKVIFPKIAKKHEQLPSLTSQGLLKHRLVWNNFISQPVNLTPSQLFDVANALEKCLTEIESESKQEVNQTHKIFFFAGISSLTLFLVTGLWWFNSQSKFQSGDNLANTTEEYQNSTEFSQGNSIITVTVPKKNIQPPQPTLPASLDNYSQLLPPELVNPPQPSNFPKPQTKKTKSSQDSSPTETNPIQPSPSTPDTSLKTVNLPPLSRFPSIYSHTTSNTNPNSVDTVKTSPLTEVKNYFEQNWQPPSELREKLEYRLIVDSNGKLQSITPIGRAARVYVDTLNLPVDNLPIISGDSISQSQQIRLVLSPPNLVNTFSESK